MQDLQSKRILITGAAGGLGQIMAQRLTAAGAAVTALVRDASGLEPLIASCLGLSVIEADLADATALEKAVRSHIAAHGPFDGLINNAAIYPKARVTELTRDDLAKVLEVNAIAAAGLVKVCATGMRDLGAGRVVNITSNTFDLGMEELGAYVASKGALIGMTRVWARELGPWNITVNAVSPGAFQTDAEKIHPDPEAYSAFIISQQSIKRRGDPVELSDFVEFLLSDRAGFITGQTIRIDGGRVTF